MENQTIHNQDQHQLISSTTNNNNINNNTIRPDHDNTMNNVIYQLCNTYKNDSLYRRLLYIIHSIIKQYKSHSSSSIIDTTEVIFNQQLQQLLQQQQLLVIVCQKYIDLVGKEMQQQQEQQSDDSVQGQISSIQSQQRYQYLITTLIPSISILHESIVPKLSLAQIPNQNNNNTVIDSNTNTNRNVIMMKNILQQQLHTAQSHLNKEAIRIAYSSIAIFNMVQYQHYYYSVSNSNSSNTNTGITSNVNNNTDDIIMKQQQQQHATEAIQSAIRSMEYCTSKYHTMIHTLLCVVIELVVLGGGNSSGGSSLNQQQLQLPPNYTRIGDMIRRIQHTFITPSTTITKGTVVVSAAAAAAATGSSNTTSTVLDQQQLHHESLMIKIQDKIISIGILERLYNGDYYTAVHQLFNIVIHLSNRITTTTTTTTNNTDNKITSSSSNKYTIESTILQDDYWDYNIISPKDILMYTLILTLATTSTGDDMHDTNNNINNMESKSHNKYTTPIPISTIQTELIDAPNFKILCNELQCNYIYDIYVTYYIYMNYKKVHDLLELHVYPILQYDIYLSQPSSFLLSSTNNDNNNSSSNGTISQLHILQDMIRTKCILLQWRAYQECPLQDMIQTLGPSITNMNQYNSNNCMNHQSNNDTTAMKEFELYIIQLLKNRYKIGTTTSLSNTQQPKIIMSFPYDTRYDYIHKKLMRTHHPYSTSTNFSSSTTMSTTSSDDDNDNKALYDTTLQYVRTSQRVLDDTYSMIIRVQCVDRDLLIRGSNNNKSVQQQYRARGRPYRGGPTTNRPYTESDNDENDDEDDDDEDDIEEIYGTSNNYNHILPPQPYEIHDDRMVMTERYDNDELDIMMDRQNNNNNNNDMNPEDMY